MDIGEWTVDGEWSATPELNRVYREIRTLGLESNLAELEAFGFTIIRDALSARSDPAGLREAVLRSAEGELPTAPLDLEGESDLQEVQLAPYLLLKDPVFEQALLNPRPLALITYLLGYSCWLSSMTSHVKGPGRLASCCTATPPTASPRRFRPIPRWPTATTP